MLDRVVRILDGALTAIGRGVSFLVLAMIGLIGFEMIARGAFGQPSAWAHELSTWLLTALIFLGGPYALLRGNFVRVDVVFGGLGPRAKALVDTFCSSLFAAVFIGVLIWMGGDFFASSFAMGERSATGGWGGPVWAAKLLVPLGGVLLGLAWLGHVLRLWRDVLDPDAAARGGQEQD